MNDNEKDDVHHWNVSISMFNVCVISFTGIPSVVMLHAYLNNQIGYDEDTLYISHCVRNHRNPFLWDST